VIDGEWAEGSSVAFYKGRLLWLHNGKSTTLEYGALPGRAAAVPRRRVGEEDVERRGQARLPNHICGEAGEVGRAHPAEQIPALPLRRQDSILEPPRQVKADE